MQETRTAKLFKNGASQAVRLPAEFRFDGEQVYVTRDPETGDVILSERPGLKAWENFFELTHSIDDTSVFMDERAMNAPPKERHLLGDGEY